jgi:hypothetical protein
MRWTEHVACIIVKRNAYKDLIGKPEKTTWKAWR